MTPDKIKKESEYFSFKELTMTIGDVTVCNYKGWSGLEIFKFLLPKEKKITNSLINDFKPELINKEKIFFTTNGNIKLESQMNLTLF